MVLFDSKQTCDKTKPGSITVEGSPSHDSMEVTQDSETRPKIQYSYRYTDELHNKGGEKDIYQDLNEMIA